MPAKRFAGILLLVSLLTISCSRSPEQYLEKGNQLSDAGKLDEAAINYKKAIQGKPGLGEAHYRLGLLELKQDRADDAYRDLNTAVNLLPKSEGARVELANLALGAYLTSPKRPKGLYQQVNQLADELLRLNPNSADAFRLQGQIALSEKRVPEAVQLLQKANGLRSSDPSIAGPLVQALIANNQFPEAEKLALSTIGAKKDALAVYDVLYILYAGTNRPQQAEELLKSKARNNPDNLTVALELANHYLNVKKPDDMTATLQRLLDDPKKFPDAPMRIGDFFAGKSDFQRAIQYYAVGEQQADAKHKAPYRKRLVLMNVALGKRSDAETVLESLLRDNPQDDDSHNMRAVLRMESGDPQRLAQAVQELQEIVRLKPEVANYRYNLGRALYASRDLNGAAVEMNRALQLRSDYDVARLYLGEISLRTGQADRALQYADEMLANNASDARARLLRVAALMARKNYGQARTELTLLIRDQPKMDEAQLQLGLLDVAEKKFSDAEKIFRKYYQGDHPDLRGLQGLVESSLAQNELDRAEQILTSELSRTPDAAAVRAALAQILTKAGRFDAALAEYRKVAAQYPKNAPVQIQIGQVLEAKGDTAAAIDSYRRAAELDRTNPAAIGYGAYALAKLGRKDEAVAAYREALKLQPGNPELLNNLAYALADTGKDLDEALKFAQQALQKLPDNAGAQDTVGWVYLKKGATESALQVFKSLVRKNPATAIYHLHLAMALMQQGDKNGARAALENALANQPSKSDEMTIRDLLKQIG